MKDELFETIAAIARPMPVMELAAIWLTTPVQTAKERTVRITVGHHVRINDKNELVDCTKEEPANYVVTECRGKATSDFSIHVINKKSLELKIIYL